MRRIAIALLATFLFILVFLDEEGFAEPGLSAIGGGRYLLLMGKASVAANKQVSAIVLDSIQGIVWVCQDVRANEPTWIETDLGCNGDKELSQQKYVIKMVESEYDDSAITASVLDTQQGIVWTCSNVIDKEAAWIQKDLKSNLEKQIPKKSKSRINIKFDDKGSLF